MTAIRRWGFRRLGFIGILFSFLVFGTVFFVRQDINITLYLALNLATVAFIVLNICDQKKVLKKRQEELLKKAEKTIRAGNFLGAQAIFDEVLKLNPRNYKAYIGKGFCCRRKMDYPGAIRQYKMAVEINNNFLEAHFLLGVCFFEERIITRSQQEFEKVLALNPDYMEAYLFLGDIYKYRGENEKARENYEQYLQLCKDENIREVVLEKIEAVKNLMPDQDFDTVEAEREEILPLAVIER